MSDDTCMAESIIPEASTPSGPGMAKRFSWRDWLIIPSAMAGLVAASGAIAWRAGQARHWELFALFLAFFAALTALTLAALALLRVFFPIRSGTYHFEADAWTCFRWRLHNLICGTLLPYGGGLPGLARNLFYRALGARIGRGPVVIGGTLLDPYLVTIGSGATIGFDSILQCHASTPDKKLHLYEIVVGKGAVIGTRSIVMPGAVIGENSVINAMSLVRFRARIPPNEVWGGIPAQKIRDL